MSEDLSKLTLVDLLDLLEPVPEPPQVSLWPQTAGWIWLGLAVACVAAWLGRRWLLTRRANAYRRAALKAVAAAGDDPAALAVIVRRAALAGYPRAEVAGLYGEDWLAFLDEAYGGSGFRAGPGRLLAVAPYTSARRAPDLASLVAEWVRHHYRPRGAAP
jgi:Ca-activated chloride channel family protein